MGDLDFPGSQNETASVDQPSSTSGRLRCDGTKRSIVRIISDEKRTGWGDGTVRDGMAFPGIARQGGDSTRLGSGSWSRGPVLGSKNPDGRGVGSSVWPTDLYSVVSVLSVYYCGRRERARAFMFTLFLFPFSVSHMLFCVHHGLYRTGYHGSGSLTVWSFWFWSGFLLYPRNETGAGSEQNVAKEDDEKGKRERLVHTIPPFPYPIPPPTLQNTDRRNENGKFLVCGPTGGVNEACSTREVDGVITLKAGRCRVDGDANSQPFPRPLLARP